MKVLGFYENNQHNVTKLVSLAKAENINFFDYSTMLDRVIPETVASRFLTRLYNEVLFLNNVYLDYFNYPFTTIEELMYSYRFDSKEECQSFINLCKEVHNTIHQ